MIGITWLGKPPGGSAERWMVLAYAAMTGKLNPLLDLFVICVRLNRITDVSITIDPDFVVEPIKVRIQVSSPPIVPNDFRIVRNITQSENSYSGWTRFFKPFKSREYLSFQAKRLFVDNKKMWLKGSGGSKDNIGSDSQRLFLFNSDRERLVIVIGLFNHTRDSDEIDVFGKLEASCNRRTGKNEDIGVGIPQTVRYRHGSADMVKTICIMRIHEYVVDRGFVLRMHSWKGRGV